MSDTKITIDHSKIKQWAEERGGRPATVSDTGKGGEAGILRLDFEPKDAPGLDLISWDEFFDKFEKERLVMMYQEKTEDGSTSRFHKFVERETAQAD
ncbi:hypothetical protein A7A08_02478 [Methyloligella halotolerans]|uniref:1,4-alpha-glucan branching enzyme n=1 Tax=Methyloligella halotolerans TaxID=1177755 RepID=A0A1E2RX51_9HYPH|nr:hypothetical protein [Methyloligella halotolerans]ODA66710.1 hypothetical protein A7A08_02478 [Methyloligella halotolerans]